MRKARLVCLLLAVALALLALSACDLSAGVPTPEISYTEGLEFYLITDGNYGVGLGKDTHLLTEILIPPTYNGKPVSAIVDEGFSGLTALKRVVIPPSVTSIGSAAFKDCTSLAEVTLPDSIVSIGYMAFHRCTSLVYREHGNARYLGNAKNPHLALIEPTDPAITTATVHPDTKVIGFGAFSLCTDLNTVSIPDSVRSIGTSAFEGCKSLIYNEYDNAYYLGNDQNPYHALIKAKNVSITAATVHPTARVIANYAFGSCAKLTEIAIGSSITSIGEDAFYSCTRLAAVHIPDLERWCTTELSAYRSSPFCYSASLYLNGALVTELVIPDSITSIGDFAFLGCASLSSVTFPDSVTSIGNGAFNGCACLSSVTFPDSVTSIGNFAFSNCEGLFSVTLPDSVTSIGSWAFDGCKRLASLTLPDSVTSIGEYAFAYCKSLAAVTIGDGVTSISDYAFSGCTSLSSVSVPDSVTSIGSGAFAYCTSLASVTIGDGVTSISDYVFEDCTQLSSVTFTDPDAWYVTDSAVEAATMTGGALLDMTEPGVNAAYMIGPYYWYRWYKK